MILLPLVVAVGCTERPAETVQQRHVDLTEVRSRHEFVRRRTNSRFEQAAFWSPDPESDAGVPLWMAPLIVQELPVDATGSRQPPVFFGAMAGKRSASASVDTDCQTVYLMVSKVSLKGSLFERWTYLWFYPAASPGRQLRCRGVRMTIGSRGHAIIWEILSNEIDLSEIYVSKPLEKASREQYGPPLPGRRFSVEPALEEYPNVVVPRIVADGPQPMGPFLYLDAAQLDVATLICRCEPSQVGEFPMSSHYRLERIQDLSALPGGGAAPDDLTLPPQDENVERYLRLPSDL
jgi:hypothetical protein